MNPTPETISRFGKPFYDEIKSDSWLSQIFFPVKPEGFHITLHRPKFKMRQNT